ncbi:MAG: hypothetical protein ABFS28_13835 [Bacteroidota bacterium]
MNKREIQFLSTLVTAALLLLSSAGFSQDQIRSLYDLETKPSKTVKKKLYGLKIDEDSHSLKCRTIPFLSASPDSTGVTIRINEDGRQTIPVGTKAETLFLLGMMDYGWDNGVGHWGYHYELIEERHDQVNIGSLIGEIEIVYEDETKDKIPMVMGVTSWFVNKWASAASHSVTTPIHEPFASRPEYAKVFFDAFKLKEQPHMLATNKPYAHYYLAVEPQDKMIRSVVITDNPDLLGTAVVSGITLTGATPGDRIAPFPKQKVAKEDLEPTLRSYDDHDWSAEIEALKDVLYTKESDLPDQVSLLEYPDEIDAAKITFKGDVNADMLSNIWVQNMMEMEAKFDPVTGVFHESGKNYPWYGGYSGIGTWSPLGIYHRWAYGRSADHYASLVIRNVKYEERLTSFVDYMDNWLYFYRKDHDPANGPENDRLDIEKWPEGVGGHWGFVVNGPCTPPVEINELQGEEEMDGHGAVMVGRWFAWKHLGAPEGEWLTGKRDHVFGHSRYESTKEAADFTCWYMDYTNRDVIFCEGEVTGWGAGGILHEKEWYKETDPKKILKNYASADMYEPYPSYTNMIGLKCSAEMAEAAGDTASASKWRHYADRIRKAMLRELVEGDYQNKIWRESPYSVLPSKQDRLVQAWFSIYYDGLDPLQLDAEMTPITRNTLDVQLDKPYGHAPVLGMGYGQGWITKSALMLDYMDDAGKLLINLAKYSYDKNMDYVDEERGIDWRKFMWIVPEGTNIMEDGRWHRIADLSNGANQGPSMHALELCAGVDDTHPDDLKILPRAPLPLTGIEVDNFFVVIPDGESGYKRARVNYHFDRTTMSFELESDLILPTLSVRIGPFETEEAANDFLSTAKTPENATLRLVSSGKYKDASAWWLWVEGMKNINRLSIQ